MKTNQTSNKWQYLASNQSVIFKPKLAKWYSDTRTVIFQWKLHNYETHLDYFCLWSKLIYPSSFEKLHVNCIKELIILN